MKALPNLAMFEKIELLHRIYPFYLLGSRIAAWLMHEDLEAYNFVMLQQLHWKTDRLRERLIQLAVHRPMQPVPGAPAVNPTSPITPEMWQQFAAETMDAKFVASLKTGATAIGGGGAASRPR